MLLVGCENGCSREDANREVTIPEGVEPMVPPAPELVAQNRLRLARMGAMRKRGMTAHDVAELISMLEVVVEVPPPEVKKLPEGYAHEMARDLLVELGEVAHPRLLSEIRKSGRFKGHALVILASQGRKEAIDEYLRLPNLNEDDVVMLQHYIPYRGPSSIEAIRRYYETNRGSLVFDSQLGVFVPRDNR